MNYDYFEVNGVTYYSYSEAYYAFVNSSAVRMYGMNIKGNLAVVHDKIHGF